MTTTVARSAAGLEERAGGLGGVRRVAQGTGALREGGHVSAVDALALLLDALVGERECGAQLAVGRLHASGDRRPVEGGLEALGGGGRRLERRAAGRRAPA